MKDINIFITRNEKKLFSNEIVFLTNCLRPGSPKTKLTIRRTMVDDFIYLEIKANIFF